MSDTHGDIEPPSTTDRVMTSLAKGVAYLADWYLIVIEIILGLGFFLLLFGANPDTEFVRFIYRSTDSAMGPFNGIFDPIDLGNVNQTVSATLNASILFAMVIYGLVLILIRSIIDRIALHQRRLRA